MAYTPGSLHQIQLDHLRRGIALAEGQIWETTKAADFYRCEQIRLERDLTRMKITLGELKRQLEEKENEPA